MDVDEEFGELQEKYYPGSKKVKKSVERKRKKRAPPKEENWLLKPKVYRVDGVDKEFYTIGALAEAVNKQPVTIRMWIDKGYMPDTRFRTPKVGEQKGRRLWTRKQIEEISRIAREELKFHKVKVFPASFTERVTAVMKNPEYAEPDEHKSESEKE